MHVLWSTGGQRIGLTGRSNTMQTIEIIILYKHIDEKSGEGTET